jgi:hypothetical protein
LKISLSQAVVNDSRRRTVFIRDTVTAQECLSGLQPEGTKSSHLNRKKVRSKNKTYKKYAKNTKLFSQNKCKAAVGIAITYFKTSDCFTKI